jgi:hypothetical protein
MERSMSETYSNPWYNLKPGVDKFKLVYNANDDGLLGYLDVELLDNEPEGYTGERNLAYWSFATPEIARRIANLTGEQWAALSEFESKKLIMDASTFIIKVVRRGQFGLPLMYLNHTYLKYSGLLLPNSEYSGVLGIYTRDY